MIISSAVVQAHPKDQEVVKGRLESLDGVEVHATTESGQMVISMEHETTGDAADVFTKIQLLEGALSASLIFNQIESEPDAVFDPNQREELQ